MERESLSLEDVFLKLTGQDVEEVESEAKKASEQIEKQGHHGFSFVAVFACTSTIPSFSSIIL